MLALREVLAEESQFLERSDGLGRAAELTGRTESVLSGTGSAFCPIIERKVSSGVSVWSAFAQAVRHLYRSASTGWTEGALNRIACLASDMLLGLVSGQEADVRDEAQRGNEGFRTCWMDWRDGARRGNDGLDRPRKERRMAAWGGRGSYPAPMSHAASTKLVMYILRPF